MLDCKVAIIVEEYDKPGQTFVTRHINSLFQGNTVVICKKQASTIDQSKPFFIYERPRLRLNTLLRPIPFISRLKSMNCLEQFLRSNDVNLVLAEFGYCGVSFYREASRFGIPMFCYFRGADASRWLNSPKYVRRLRKMVDHIDGIFAVSRFVIEKIAREGITHPNTHAIPSGVDTDYFAPSRKDPNLIASVGRFVAKKGHMVTLEAFRRLASIFPDIRLEFVGDGELLELCQAFTNENGLSDRVLFHGYRDHDFIRDLLARSRFYIQHSVTDENGETEGMPTSIQEAMATGNAIVSTAHAGIPEHIINGVNGFLVPEHDLDNYVERLRQILNSNQLAAQMANNARAYAVENLDYRICMQRVESAMREILDRRAENIKR
jgi:glycosyltransferase involved in cell wall biosynthesis